jgi:hypothetical protein
MKFKKWFDNWDQTRDPEVRRLCEIAYGVGYDQGKKDGYDQRKKDAQFEQTGRCVHGVPVTELCRECCG